MEKKKGVLPTIRTDRGLKHFKADHFIFTTTDVSDKFSSAKK